MNDNHEVTFDDQEPEYVPVRVAKEAKRSKLGLSARLVKLGVAQDEEMAKKLMLGAVVLLFLVITAISMISLLQTRAAEKLNVEPQGKRVHQL